MFVSDNFNIFQSEALTGTVGTDTFEALQSISFLTYNTCVIPVHPLSWYLYCALLIKLPLFLFSQILLLDRSDTLTE